MAFNGSGCSRSSSGTAEHGLKKMPWTPAEDNILGQYVEVHGEGNWGSIQEITGLNKSGKSCRNRWANYLRPDLKKGAFSPEEEELIIELHGKHGNKWAHIASQLHGRTENEVKNYWNMRRKKCQRAGSAIHPREMRETHQPLNSLPLPTGSSHLASFQPQDPNRVCFSGLIESPSTYDPLIPNMPDKSRSANFLMFARDGMVILGLPAMCSPRMATSTLETFSSDNVIATPNNGARDFDLMDSEIVQGRRTRIRRMTASGLSMKSSEAS